MNTPPRLRIVAIEGNPTPEERRVLEQTVTQLAEAEHQATGTSLWLRASRAQGRRLGMLDYRDRFAREDAWRLSTRFAMGGREYQGLVGRGDSR